MPVFAACGFRPEVTALIWALTISGVQAWMPYTPAGFCAVKQVMAEVPCTPNEANTFRSAWIPAPPPLSDPAMVRAQGILSRFMMVYARARRRRSLL